VRGEQFAVALSLLCNGRPVLGFLGCPNLPPQLPAAADRNGHVRKAADGVGSLFWASDGGGAYACSLADADDPPHVGLAAAVLGKPTRLSVSSEAATEKLVRVPTAGCFLTAPRYVGQVKSS
jgi:3'-phosphoadenosine 5'-phosphosulfate (PAPS) 3'-phosphatase